MHPLVTLVFKEVIMATFSFYSAPGELTNASLNFSTWARGIISEINADEDIRKASEEACKHYADGLRKVINEVHDDRFMARNAMALGRRTPRWMWRKHCMYNDVEYTAEIDLLLGYVHFIEE